MKRDRSVHDDQTDFSLKRLHLQNQLIVKDTKEEQSYLQLNPNYLNLSVKKHIIEKVQSWLDNIRSANR